MPLPSDPTARALANLTSDWVARRDRIILANRDNGGGGQMEFLDTLRAECTLMGDTLPGFTIAQMEALCELASAWLGEMRMRETAFRRG